MNAHRRAQRLIDPVDRIEQEAWPTAAEDDRRDHDMQPVEAARRHESRQRVGTALDEHAAQPQPGERRQDRRRLDMPIHHRQGQQFDAGKLAARARRRDDNAADAVVGQQAGGPRQPAARIEHDARGIGAGDAPNGQLRVVGERAADADDDRIDQGAKAVQMREARRSIDIAGMPARRGDPPVERLADLADDHKIVNRAGAQRSKYVFPRRLQVIHQSAKHARNRRPRVERALRAGRRISAKAGRER